MMRELLWTPRSGPGLEHLQLRESPAGVRADGVVLGCRDDRPFRLRYRLQLDARWRVRTVVLERLGEAGETLVLSADGAGRWHTVDGQELDALADCLDVDISATPLTNTLPVRRLSWRPGQSVELKVVYLEAPEFAVRAVRQRYTCLTRDAHGGRFRYQGLDSGVEAEIDLDADGLVRAYGNLFGRLECGINDG